MSISFPTNQAQVQQSSNQGIRSQVRKDVEDLSTALQSGDLKTAQGSFADLQKLLQSSGAIGAASASASGSPLASSANPILSDFQTLGQDLTSGNLAGAQKDFAQLQTDATAAAAQPGSGQVAGHRHHRHHHQEAPPAADSTTANSSTPSSAPASTGAQQPPQSVNLVA